MMIMRIKPNNQQHLQQQQNNKIASPGGTDIVQKNFAFLPMLCSSTKQVKLSHRRCASSTSTTSSSVTDDPSSPKVGCMGQVKRNNKVVGFPSIISFTSSTSSSNSSNNSTTTTTHHHHVIKCHEHNNYTSNNIVKYNKLKRFFSTKSPTSVITAARAATSRSHKGKNGRKNVGNVVCLSKGNESSISSSNCNNKSSLVNIVDMDPPLPVVKRIVQKQEGNNDGENTSTLWKRRSGRTQLKSLQLQVIQQNVSLLLPANNTV